MRKKIILLLIAIGIAFVLMACDADKEDTGSETGDTADSDTRAALQGQLEILTWWSSPGEVEALQSLVDVFNSRYSGLDFINIESVEGNNVDMATEATARYTAGNPPSVMQLLPRGYTDWLPNNQIESLDWLYEQEGWTTAFPAAVLDAVKEAEGYYGVPVGLHRTNSMFYNPLLVPEPPQTFEELITLSQDLKAQGILPLIVDNENGAYFAAEASFAASAGILFYSLFYAGVLNLNDTRHLSSLSVALDDFKRLMDATDFEAGINLSWTEASEVFRNGGAAMYINGDWVKAYLVSLGATPGIDFKVAAVPGTQGLFSYTVDTFVLCQGTAFRDNAIELLKVMGSREGQAAFSPRKGATPIHRDVSTANWDDIALQTYSDYITARIMVSPEDPHYAMDGLGQSFVDYVSGAKDKLRTLQIVRASYQPAPE